MCTFGKDGVSFIKGDFLKYNSDISNIKPELIAELSSNEANGWSMFLLHRHLIELKDEINHSNICPVNVSAVQKLIREEISKQPQVLWKRVLSVAKDLTVLVTFISIILTLLGILKL